MIKAIIIEDEHKAADMLKIMVEKSNNDVIVLEICNDLPAGVRSIKKYKPDIVFLDIEMPGYTGLQLMEFFNEEEVDFEIIFTTAFNNYAIKAFELSAIDYILKPIQIDKLNAAVNKFKLKQQKTKVAFQKLDSLKQNLQGVQQNLVVPVSSGVEIIKFKDIQYLQADGSYCKLFLTSNKHLTISKNLKFFEEQLGEGSDFFRTHRSYLVNINTISKVLRSDGGTVILNDGTVLPITSEKIEDLIKYIS